MTERPLDEVLQAEELAVELHLEREKARRAEANARRTERIRAELRESAATDEPVIVRVINPKPTREGVMT